MSIFPISTYFLVSAANFRHLMFFWWLFWFLAVWSRYYIDIFVFLVKDIASSLFLKNHIIFYQYSWKLDVHKYTRESKVTRFKAGGS